MKVFRFLCFIFFIYVASFVYHINASQRYIDLSDDQVSMLFTMSASEIIDYLHIRDDEDTYFSNALRDCSQLDNLLKNKNISKEKKIQQYVALISDDESPFFINTRRYKENPSQKICLEMINSNQNEHVFENLILGVCFYNYAFNPFEQNSKKQSKKLGAVFHTDKGNSTVLNILSKIFLSDDLPESITHKKKDITLFLGPSGNNDIHLEIPVFDHKGVEKEELSKGDKSEVLVEFYQEQFDCSSRKYKAFDDDEKMAFFIIQKYDRVHQFDDIPPLIYKYYFRKLFASSQFTAIEETKKYIKACFELTFDFRFTSILKNALETFIKHDSTTDELKIFWDEYSKTIDNVGKNLEKRLNWECFFQVERQKESLKDLHHAVNVFNLLQRSDGDYRTIFNKKHGFSKEILSGNDEIFAELDEYVNENLKNDPVRNAEMEYRRREGPWWQRLGGVVMYALQAVGPQIMMMQRADEEDPYEKMQRLHQSERIDQYKSYMDQLTVLYSNDAASIKFSRERLANTERENFLISQAQIQGLHQRGIPS